MRAEPKWWARARSLKSMGLTIDQISSRLGVARSSVVYVLSEKARKAAIERSSIRHKEYMDQHGFSRPQSRNMDRQRLRHKALTDYRANGGDLLRLYKEYGCE